MTDLSVTDGLVGEREFSGVVTAHISSNFDGSPVFATVNFEDGTDHLGGDDHVSEVSLDTLGLRTVRSVFDGFLELLDESAVSGSSVSSERSSVLGAEKSDDFLLGHLDEFIELDTSVDLLLERLSLDGLGRGSGHT